MEVSREVIRKMSIIIIFIFFTSSDLLNPYSLHQTTCNLLEQPRNKEQDSAPTLCTSITRKREEKERKNSSLKKMNGSFKGGCISRSHFLEILKQGNFLHY